MSLILEALEKSDQERQTFSGNISSINYPVHGKENTRPGLITALLTVTGLLASALIWILWLQPGTSPSPVIAVAPASAPISIPQSSPVAITPEPVIAAVPRKVTPDKSSKNVAVAPQQPVLAEDPLKGLPALNITGYIHNDQNGSLAMINNQLVKEGEELSPGLRLIKILDNGAIFSYKGYVFSR